jgi:hypothetical protein
MRFRKKPVVIEAIQFDGNNNTMVDKFMDGAIHDFIGHQGREKYHDNCVCIRTLEGNMVAEPGDWIIRGIKGEFYPCKPDIFEATYELAEPVVEPAR